MNRKKMSAFMVKVLAAAALVASLTGTAFAEEGNSADQEEIRGSVTVVYRDQSETGAGSAEADVSVIPPDVPQKASNGEDAAKDSASVISQLAGDAVTGAEFTFYRVADIADLTEGGHDVESGEVTISGASFIPLFEGIRVDASTDPAEILDAVKAAYATPEGMEKGDAYTCITGEDGIGKAEGMKTGVYLGEETKPSEGHYASIPFLFTLPVTGEDGSTWKYDRVITPKPLPSGNLVISKTVQGNAGNPEDLFGFAVSFDFSQTYMGPDSFHYTRSDGAQGMVANGGVLSLKSGESVRIEKIPAGCRYEVTEREANKNGYVTSAEGNTGVIRRKSEARAEFVNTRNKTENKRTGTIQTGDTILPIAGGILCIVAALAMAGAALGMAGKSRRRD